MLPAKHHHHDHWSSTAGDLVIAKLDSTKNEIEGVDIEGFPTIKMFKKETNEEVEYVGRKKIHLFMFTCIRGLSYVDLKTFTFKKEKPELLNETFTF